MDVAQNCAHLRRGLLGLFGEDFDLLRDHGKTAAFVASLRGFDRGVHREQLRLRGQIIHAGDDFADGLALRAEAQDALGDGPHLRADALHAFDGLVHGKFPAQRNLGRILRLAGDGLRAVARHLRSLPHFLDRRRGLGHGAGGLRRARGELLHGGDDLPGGGGEHRRGVGDARGLFAQRFVRPLEGAGAFLDVAEHLVKRVGEQPQFVAAHFLRAPRIIARFRSPAGRRGERQDGPRDEPLEPSGERQREEKRTEEDQPRDSQIRAQPSGKSREIGAQIDRAEARIVERDGTERHRVTVVKAGAVGLRLCGEDLVLRSAGVARKDAALPVVKTRRDDRRLGGQRVQHFLRIFAHGVGECAGGVRERARDVIGEDVRDDGDILRERCAGGHAFVGDEGGAREQQRGDRGAEHGHGHFLLYRKITK